MQWHGRKPGVKNGKNERFRNIGFIFRKGASRDIDKWGSGSDLLVEQM